MDKENRKEEYFGFTAAQLLIEKMKHIEISTIERVIIRIPLSPPRMLKPPVIIEKSQ